MLAINLNNNEKTIAVNNSEYLISSAPSKPQERLRSNGRIVVYFGRHDIWLTFVIVCARIAAAIKTKPPLSVASV